MDAGGRTALALLAVGVGLLIAALNGTGAMGQRSSLVGGAAVTVVCWAVALVSQSALRGRPNQWISVGVLFPLVTGVTYGILGLDGIGVRFRHLVRAPTLIAGLTELSVAVGMLAWLAGYWYGGLPQLKNACGRLARQVLPDLDAIPNLGSVGRTALATGALCQLGLFVRGGLGYLADAGELTRHVDPIDNLLRMLLPLAKLGLSLCAMEVARSGRSRRLLLGATGVQLLVALFSGSKQPVLAVIAAAAIPGLLAKRTSLARPLALMALAALLILPFNAHYRALLRPGPGQHAPHSEAVDLFFEAGRESWDQFRTNPSGYFEEGISSGSNRADSMTAAAIVINSHEYGGMPKRGLAALGERTALLAIPRVLWPGKPIDTAGLDVNREYYGSPSMSASAVTLFGDGYRHAGLVGVVVALVMAGILARCADQVLDPRNGVVAGVLAPTVLPALVKSEADFAAYLVGTVRLFLVLSIGLWTLTRITSKIRR